MELIIILLVSIGIFFWKKTPKKNHHQPSNAPIQSAQSLKPQPVVNPKYDPNNINRELLYNNQDPLTPNEYVFYYQKPNGKITHTTCAFPKPDTKYLKLNHWTKTIDCLDVIMRIRIPGVTPSSNIDQKMFDYMFKSYIGAYIQSFKNYRNYHINVNIMISPKMNHVYGIHEYQAEIDFQAIKPDPSKQPINPNPQPDRQAMI